MIGQLGCDEFGDCGSQAVAIYDHDDSSITDATQIPVVYEFSGR